MEGGNESGYSNIDELNKLSEEEALEKLGLDKLADDNLEQVAGGAGGLACPNCGSTSLGALYTPAGARFHCYECGSWFN